MSRSRSRPSANRSTQVGVRLQKLLASAGLGSRRKCEQLILAGRITVDGQVVVQLGSRADPQTQKIRVDGELLPRRPVVYYVVNKPPGYICTRSDPARRPRVIDLVPNGDQLFPVGRLDMASEGLILVTNDGDLANRVAHPQYGVEKTYSVEVVGHPTASSLNRLRRGIRLAEAVVRVQRLVVKRHRKSSTVLEIVLNEGRNREIRRMLARLGHKVIRLRRTALGPLRLGNQPEGSYRTLTPAELTKLNRVAKPTKKS